MQSSRCSHESSDDSGLLNEFANIKVYGASHIQLSAVKVQDSSFWRMYALFLWSDEKDQRT